MCAAANVPAERPLSPPHDLLQRVGQSLEANVSVLERLVVVSLAQLCCRRNLLQKARDQSGIGFDAMEGSLKGCIGDGQAARRTQIDARGAANTVVLANDFGQLLTGVLFKHLGGTDFYAQAAITAAGFFDMNRRHGYLLTLRMVRPSCRTSIAMGIWPTRWVEHDRHGS
jgi:hypothetical protein